MKAKLTFNLPEESTDFKWAINGYDYWSELNSMQVMVRAWRKHGHNFKSADDVLEHLWDALPHELIDTE